MARTTIPVTAAELAAIANEAEEFANELFDLHSRMEKRFTADPGDALDVLGKLGRLVESAMQLQRMVVGSGKMREALATAKSRAAVDLDP